MKIVTGKMPRKSQNQRTLRRFIGKGCGVGVKEESGWPLDFWLGQVGGRWWHSLSGVDYDKLRLKHKECIVPVRHYRNCENG